MSRKAPSTSTLKRLFALSGNICAFPSCEDCLVNTVGDLIGQACHIEAAEEGGERYNPSMTDAQRASFENLILLCANHHTTTDNTDIYTVEVLRGMKSEHEGKFRSNKYSVSNEVIRQATISFSQSNQNSVSGTQHNYQASEITINHGITPTEVSHLVKALFDQNFPILVESAKQTAEENILKFEDLFKREITTKLIPEQLGKFADPDIQVVLCQAAQASARQDSEDLRKILADLIIQRVQNDEVELKQKVLNEAIRTVSKLTKGQMRIVTLCFLLRYSSFTGSGLNWESLKLNFEKYFKPFLEFQGSVSEVTYLQYLGCGQLESSIIKTDFIKTFMDSYTYAFISLFSTEEVAGLNLPDDMMKEIFTELQGGFRVNIENKEKLKGILEGKKLGEDSVNQILTMYDSKVMSKDDVLQRFRSEMGWTSGFFEKIDSFPINQLTLTPIGIAIAISYFESVIDDRLDINIWIN